MPHHVLYLTPYFPPQGQVGALRPLKFCRHLPALGWEPVVLADLHDGATLNRQLFDAVPSSIPLIYDYSDRARGAFVRFSAGQLADTRRKPARPNPLARFVPRFLDNPELLPLGEHSVHMAHAFRAGLEVLERLPCEAILANIDPHATALVGARLARATGLPLVLDLRDPWSVCELRRPHRPGPLVSIVDRLERSAVEVASAVILNTDKTLADYRAHYADLSPERFTCIRNHCDPTLLGGGHHDGFDRFTMLFLGHFRRFVEGDILLDALVELRRRGLGAADLQLVVTGQCPAATLEHAERLGVRDMLHLHPFVPYTEIGPIMEAADLLVALSNRSTQRIPAKLYDYAASQRPMLLICDNPEVDTLLDGLAGATSRSLDDVAGVADVVEATFKAGRQQVVARDVTPLSSRVASEALGRVLDRVAGR